MEHSIATTTTTTGALAPREFGAAELDVIKNVIAKGATDAELKTFVLMAQKLGLDPISKQIHCVKRRARLADGQWGEIMTVTVGIDGYRLVAERTGRYCPGRAPTYEYDREGKPVSATAYVLKLAGGSWHEVSAVAFWEEYVQTNRDGQPTAMWARMPRLMLGKCAEALALRRAFPAELSGVYTDDEMAQPVVIDAPAPAPQPVPAAQPVVIDAPAPVATSPAKAPAWLTAEVRNLGLRAKKALQFDLPQPMRDALVSAMDAARAALKNGVGDDALAARDALTAALTGATPAAEAADAQPA